MAGISDDIDDLRVNRNDFMNALEEVTPAFGVAKEELEQVVQNGIIHFSPVIDVSTFLRSVQLLILNIEHRKSYALGNSSLIKFAPPLERH